MSDLARVASIYRYPVKGLSPERLGAAHLSVGCVIPGDRRYAIENGPSGFDPAAPQHLPKIKFLMLMRNEGLATLATRFDDATTTLTIGGAGRELLRADLSAPAGRERVEAFFREFMPAELRGAPQVLEAPGHSFSDVSAKVVSIINLASVAAVAKVAGQPVDPLRFRGNLHVEGLPAWAEFDLMGRELETASGVRLRVTKRIKRCAATQVDPGSGRRDLDVPKLLMDNFGHMDCGIYAEVIAPGALREGDRLAPAPGGAA